MALQYETTKEHTITVTGYGRNRKTSGHSGSGGWMSGENDRQKCIFRKGRFRECKYSKDGGNAWKICIL